MKISIEELSKKMFQMQLTYGDVVYSLKSNGEELEINFMDSNDMDGNYVVFDTKKGIYKTNHIKKIQDDTTKFILDKADVNKLFLDDKLCADKKLKKKMTKEWREELIKHKTEEEETENTENNGQ